MKAKVLSSVSPSSKTVEKKIKVLCKIILDKVKIVVTMRIKVLIVVVGEVRSISEGFGMVSGVNFQELDKKEKGNRSRR